MAYGSSKPPGPKLEVYFDDILPFYTVLKDGTLVELQRVVNMLSLSPQDKVNHNISHDGSGPRGAICTDKRTFLSIHNLLNYEIKQGNSYPFEETLTEEKFDEYFFGYDAFVLRTVQESPPHTRTDRPGNAAIAAVVDLPDPQFVGCFYVKPNYPGRSSHICNGGFLVSPYFRKQGAGYLLGERFRVVAQRLGYRGSVFNLVFHDNPASLRLWTKLGFNKVGDIPEAGRHPVELGRSTKEDPHHFVTATVWHLNLAKPLKEIILPWEDKYMDIITSARKEAAQRRSLQQRGGRAAEAKL